MRTLPVTLAAAARSLLLTLGIVLLCASALAQSPGNGNRHGNDNGDGGGGPVTGPPAPGPAPAPEPSPAPARSTERPAEAPAPGHTLVAPLRFASAGTLVIDGGRLEADSPWVDFLAPGMWLELQGSWQGEAFRVSALAVTRPAYFSYYLGPARAAGMGSGWVEAWFAADGTDEPATPLSVRRVDPERAPLALARAVEGRWAAVPEDLLPAPSGADGWSLLHGRADGEAVRWTSAQPFP